MEGNVFYSQAKCNSMSVARKWPLEADILSVFAKFPGMQLVQLRWLRCESRLERVGQLNQRPPPSGCRDSFGACMFTLSKLTALLGLLLHLDAVCTVSRNHRHGLPL
jgi:hypothetical protein